MPGPALSTMWAQQQRFDADFSAFARIAQAAGYAGIEVSHSTDAGGLEALLHSGGLPVPSLHAPCPLMPARGGGRNSALNLASTDEEERAEAVEHHHRTIDYAARCGAHYVVVHLGGLPRPLDEETELRSLFNIGLIATARAASTAAAARQHRARAVGPHLAAARRSLTELVAAAARHGVVVGLENRLHFHEIPSAAETADLLAEYSRSEAGYWHDTGHAEVQHRLGLINAPETLARLAPLLVGCHLHDVRGIVDHRAPGNGDVNWGYIAAALPPDVPRTLEIDQREPEPLLARAIGVLRDAGILGETAQA